MRIGLINPPAPFLTNQKVFPNLGLISIATQMRKKGYDVDVLDFLGIENGVIVDPGGPTPPPASGESTPPPAGTGDSGSGCFIKTIAFTQLL